MMACVDRVGLDEHDDGGAVEGARDARGRGACDEVGDAAAGGVVGAREGQGLEEGGQGACGGGGREVPVVGGGGHVVCEDGEDVEEARALAPAGQADGDEVIEGRRWGLEAHDGVCDAELVLLLDG